MAETWCVLYWYNPDMSDPHLWGVYQSRDKAMLGLEACWANPTVSAVRLFEQVD